MSVRVLEGDCRAVLAGLPAGSVQCVVTSPPYFGLRDYGVAGQIGLEASPDAYVARMVEVFAEVRRVLRDDGTLWLNLGDSYAREPAKGGSGTPNGRNVPEMGYTGAKPIPLGLKAKDLIGVPWRVAFALQENGWYLRSDIVWSKPNGMPESVQDRPTRSHEYVFLFSKSERYTYDADAIAERSVLGVFDGIASPDKVARTTPHIGSNGTGMSSLRSASETRNARSVWSITTQPFSGAHFATMPPELVRRCVAAGSRRGDTVLDPFGGAGTTGLVADRLGRDAVLIELNPQYAEMARCRIRDDSPLFTDVA
jgi:DNA modification methylase